MAQTKLLAGHNSSFDLAQTSRSGLSNASEPLFAFH